VDRSNLAALGAEAAAAVKSAQASAQIGAAGRARPPTSRSGAGSRRWVAAAAHQWPLAPRQSQGSRPAPARQGGPPSWPGLHAGRSVRMSQCRGRAVTADTASVPARPRPSHRAVRSRDDVAGHLLPC